MEQELPPKKIICRVHFLLISYCTGECLPLDDKDNTTIKIKIQESAWQIICN